MSGESPTTLRILIADDDALISMFLAEMLVAMGHEVCALEATEAGIVSAAARHRPGLMIVDSHLAEGSGVAAVATVLLTGYVPHLFISGGPVRVVSPETIVLEKPFLEADLVRAMERALGAARPSGESPR